MSSRVSILSIILLPVSVISDLRANVCLAEWNHRAAKYMLCIKKNVDEIVYSPSNLSGGEFVLEKKNKIYGQRSYIF